MPKQSTHPGPRARDVDPEPKGEYYRYSVDKFWIICDMLEDGRLVAKTRRGKTHVLEPNDPRLRKARWYERLLNSTRFPML